MKQVLAVEIRRAFTGWAFRIVALLGVLIALSEAYSQAIIPSRADQAFLAQHGAYPLTLYDRCLGMSTGGMGQGLFILVFPLMATIPYAGSLHSDRSSGYDIVMITRCSRRTYYVAKQIAAFCSGGVAVVLPYLLNFWVVAMFLPAIRPLAATHFFGIDDRSMWAGLFYSHPLAYMMAYFLLIFLWAGCLGSIPLALSYVIHNKIVAIATPFLFLVAMTIVQSVLTVASLRSTIEQYSPLTFMQPDQPAAGISFNIVAIEWLVIMTGVTYCLLARARRDEAL